MPRSILGTKSLSALFVVGLFAFSTIPLLLAETPQIQDAVSPQNQQPQPQTPAAPYQLPPSPPQVTYNDGLLEVKAFNSTIADVVSAIRNVTGATIEGMEPSSTDRIFGQFGPDSPNSVLGAVLVGSPYDFIIMGSNSDTEGASKQHIILSKKGNPAAAYQRASMPSRPMNGNNGMNGNPSGVNDQYSYSDPQWSVPQYHYVAPSNPQQPVQPGQAGFQPGVPNPMGQANMGQQNQNGQPGGTTPSGRPQHYGALYSQQLYQQQQQNLQNSYGQPSFPQQQNQNPQNPYGQPNGYNPPQQQPE